MVLILSAINPNDLLSPKNNPKLQALLEERSNEEVQLHKFYLHRIKILSITLFLANLYFVLRLATVVNTVNLFMLVGFVLVSIFILTYMRSIKKAAYEFETERMSMGLSSFKKTERTRRKCWLSYSALFLAGFYFFVALVLFFVEIGIIS